MSSSNFCFLTCIQISKEAGQVIWYSHLLKNFPQFFVIHIVKDFGIVNKAAVDVFLQLSCFFDDLADVGNLISGSSAFSKTSLNIWKFMVQVLLKRSLENSPLVSIHLFSMSVSLFLLYWLCQSLWLCGSLWKILQEMGIPDCLTCLLRNLYVGQEATVRTGHGTTDWFQIGKGVYQGCILSPCLFNLYAEYIMRNAGLEEAQAGIRIVGRNNSNLKYADDTTLMAESE